MSDYYQTTAKKSTASAPKYEKRTRRQAALAKDKISNLSNRGNEEVEPDVNERRRRKKVPYGAVYDENGMLLNSSMDLCDCLQKACKGCHFPCPRCKSLKCGVECRVHRKYTYDEIEYHGYELVVKNNFK